jgi:hypothetical protein
VVAEAKRKPHRDDSAREKRERTHQENALDEALNDTFPVSDPVSVRQIIGIRRGDAGRGPPRPQRSRLRRRSERSDRISLRLHLLTAPWEDGGCPMRLFIVIAAVVVVFVIG